MDYRFREERIKPDAIIALVLGIVVAYVIQRIWFVAPGSTIFNMLIVGGVGGLYYTWRRVL